jgi:plastocyanin
MMINFWSGIIIFLDDGEDRVATALDFCGGLLIGVLFFALGMAETMAITSPQLCWLVLLMFGTILAARRCPSVPGARTRVRRANTMHQRCGHLWQFIGILAIVAVTLGRGLGAARAQEGAAVSIVDFAFDPAAVETPVGTTVTWTNDGAARHTVTSSDGAFDSDELALGASFSQNFTAAGTYTYFCQIHPQMTGTGTVVEAAAAVQDDEADQPRRSDRASPAAADGQAAEGNGVETVRMPRTGVGTVARAGQMEDLLLFTGLVAAVLGAGAVVTYRRS